MAESVSIILSQILKGQERLDEKIDKVVDDTTLIKIDLARRYNHEERISKLEKQAIELNVSTARQAAFLTAVASLGAGTYASAGKIWTLIAKVMS